MDYANMALLLFFYAALGVLLIWVYVRMCEAVGRYWLSRGRSGQQGFWLSVITTPLLGWVIGALLQADTEVLAEQEVEAGRMKKCPYCAEVIKGEAVICRFCGRQQAGVDVPHREPVLGARPPPLPRRQTPGGG